MSTEELWKLFPIFLAEHDPIWETWYADEKRRLESILPADEIRAVSHIGSTSVSTIWAKPIIDILVEIGLDSDMENVKWILEENGFLCMNQSENRISFNKGYTENGFAQKVFHLHLRYAGDHDELYFRDYLIEHPQIAHEYEKLKLKLWRKYEYDRDGYTNAKTEFVSKYTREAKEKYGGRY